MAKYLPVQAPAAAPRVIHYPDPAAQGVLAYVTPRELAARRAEQRMLYARWAARQAAIAEHDRKVRRFLLGFGAVIALALLAGIGVAAWWIWRAVTGITPDGLTAGLGLLGLLGLALLVVGGSRCITVVQHWHR
jgi:hypothetical protein